MRIKKRLFHRGFMLSAAAAMCSLLVFTTMSNAATVHYSFTGTVGSVSGALKSTMPSGSSMFGTFSFENGTLPNGTGRYMDAVQSLSIHFGSYSVSLDPAGDTNIIRLVDNSSGDLWRLRTSVMGNDIGQYSPTEFRMDLEDEDGGVINGTSLQNPPSLGSLTSNQWRLVFENSGGSTVRVQGIFNTLTAVPLPAAVVLFGIGLISLVGLGAGGLRNLRGSQTY